MKPTNSFPLFLQAFFQQWLVQTTQQLCAHGALLPRHLAAVSALRLQTTEAGGGKTAPAGYDRHRNPCFPSVRRRRAQRLDRYSQLPIGSSAQLLHFCCGP